MLNNLSYFAFDLGKSFVSILRVSLALGKIRMHGFFRFFRFFIWLFRWRLFLIPLPSTIKVGQLNKSVAAEPSLVMPIQGRACSGECRTQLVNRHAGRQRRDTGQIT